MFFTRQAKYYMTKGVQKEVPIILIYEILEIFEKNREAGIEADYLRVFKFRNHSNGFTILIEESQEVPEYKYEEMMLGHLEMNELIVWAISDESVEGEEIITLLLPDEY